MVIMNKVGRLGRGLNSLIGAEVQVSIPPEQVSPITKDQGPLRVNIDQIVPGPFQPRRAFGEAALEGLAQSIKEVGVMQPVVVRVRAAGGYELVAGERRWRAARLAGLESIPAIVNDLDDAAAAQWALIENLQRE